jgi:hypothetical protein
LAHAAELKIEQWPPEFCSVWCRKVSSKSKRKWLKTFRNYRARDENSLEGMDIVSSVSIKLLTLGADKFED